MLNVNCCKYLYDRDLFYSVNRSRILQIFNLKNALFFIKKLKVLNKIRSCFVRLLIKKYFEFFLLFIIIFVVVPFELIICLLDCIRLLP